VTLSGDSQTGRLFIALEHDRSGDWLELEVEAGDAFKALGHPHAYAGRAWDQRAAQRSRSMTP
jgi:hypothetical protein